MTATVMSPTLMTATKMTGHDKDHRKSTMIYDDHRKSTTIIENIRWPSKIYDDHRKSTMIIDDLRRSFDIYSHDSSFCVAKGKSFNRLITAYHSRLMRSRHFNPEILRLIVAALRVSSIFWASVDLHLVRVISFVEFRVLFENRPALY